MTVVSVDVAYKDYRDVGIAAFSRDDGDEVVRCELVRPDVLRGTPDADELARYLSGLCEERGAGLLLLDGPQGWKSPENGLEHSRVCERALNTPAKTGLPGKVKPRNYAPFVSFSVALYDSLAHLGWSRFAGGDVAVSTGRGRLLVESFPFAAWRSLGIPPLPSKRKASEADLRWRAAGLAASFGLRVVGGDPSHDELQAAVAGLAGVAMEGGERQRYEARGVAPFEVDGTWREGFIVNPLAGGGP